MERCEPNQIHHIPRPLYHWRIFRESAARDMNIKPYAKNAGIQALSDHLQRQSIDAKTRFLPELAAYSVLYKLPEDKPNVDLIMLVNQSDLALKEMIQEIRDNTEYPAYQIILGVPKENFHDLLEFSEKNNWKIFCVPLQDDVKQNFAVRADQVISSGQSEYICLLDKHLRGFKSGWLADLMGQAIQDNIGAVAPRLIYQPPKLIRIKERVYSNGVVFLPDQMVYHLFNQHERTDNGYFGWGKLSRGYSALSEKCLLFKRSDYTNLGGFDERLATPLLCVVDICLKLREATLRNILRPSIELYIQANNHYNNRLKEEAKTDLAILGQRWGAWFKKDPAFNPNLTIVDENKLLVDISK
jgi:hypothetical protein